VCIVSGHVKKRGKKTVLEREYLERVSKGVCDLKARNRPHKVLMEYLGEVIPEKVEFT